MLDETATLTGLAIGDALGMPFETLPAHSEALKNWDGSFQPGFPTNTLQPNRKAGEWTDDTMMAKALASSLIECSVYNPAHASANYIDWYRSGDLRGIGKSTREAMDRIIKGHHWNSSGVLHALGNGAAMRAAPLGIFYRSNLITVAEMTRVDAWITHRSVEAQESAVAVALGVAILASGCAEKDQLIRPIVNLLQGGEGSQTTLIETRLLELHEFLATDPSPDKLREYQLLKGVGSLATQSVPAAFLCFLATHTFKDAVEMAVRGGGDTDTIAAITGALAGTYYGPDHVDPYLAQLEDFELLRHLDHLLWIEAPEIPEDV
jgi:ADP-ribosylglycohydrolase